MVTLGFGALVQNMLLANNKYVGYNGIQTSPPSHLRLTSSTPSTTRTGTRSSSCSAFTVCALAVANVRRGKAGGALIAVRTNERAAAALGIDVVQTKLFAFVVGAGVAGIGGILLVLPAADGRLRLLHAVQLDARSHLLRDRRGGATCSAR